MEENNSSAKKIEDKLTGWSKKVLAFLARWFFLLSLVTAAAFCVFVWYSYVWKAAWDEAKKQSYISEQAKFSFDKAGYKKMIDLMNNRKVKFANYPPFAGRDIFFPENF